MFSETLTMRLFTILDLQENSSTIYPELFLKAWPGLDLSVGAFAFTGAPETKFGSRLTGPNTVFVKGRYSRGAPQLETCLSAALA